jgi:hypothetical protein
MTNLDSKSKEQLSLRKAIIPNAVVVEETEKRKKKLPQTFIRI